MGLCILLLPSATPRMGTLMFGNLLKESGVSAVPMAARVANKVGQEEDPHNYLLMHAMGPNVSGVIGSAVAAGVLLELCKMFAS